MTDRVAKFQAELPELEWVTDEGRVARLSQDFLWFSPVLNRQLSGLRAEIAVRPRSEDEIRRVVSLCARLAVPITIRGSGTGNYGQAVPLRGGLLLDLSAYNRFLWCRDGVARSEAGMRLADLEKALVPHRQEIRCMPSTYRSATVGGLFGGGFGGIGSINYGPLACKGNVMGVRAMTIEAEPQCIELRGDDALSMHHMWGTNGLVLEVELALAPAVNWSEQLVTFTSFAQALAFGDALSRAPGILKRELAVLSSPIPDYLRHLSQYLPPGCHAAIVALAPLSEPAFLDLVRQFDGSVSYCKRSEEVAAGNRTLLEYTWNHTTLHAMRVDNTLTYIQSAFTPGKHIDQVLLMDRLLGGEVLMHVEFIRNIEGLMTCSALQMVRFTTEERLQQIMQIYRDNGVRINDPHVFIVEDGKAGGALAPAILQAKQRFDPQGLLNPGKVRAWMDSVSIDPASNITQARGGA